MAMSKKEATMNSTNKRSQAEKDKTMALVAIGVASVALVAGLMISKAFWSQANYLSKVADQKEVAVEQLESNKASIDSLRTSYAGFTANNPNMIGGNSNETGGNNGDNAKLVLDALPSEYDFPGLVSSLEALLSAYTITSISGVDDSLVQKTANATGVVEIPIRVEFTSTYEGHKQAINLLRRSIRPFKIVKVELSGTNNELDSSIDLITYYQPATGLKIERAEVQ